MPQHKKTEPEKKKKQPRANIGSAYAAADWMDWKKRPVEFPSSEEEDAKLASLKSDVDTKKKLNQTKRTLERSREVEIVHERLDVFGSIECQKWYLKHVREALESPEISDKLHDHIRNHLKYDYAGEWRPWNADLAALLDLKNYPAGYKGNKRENELRIATACQQVMVDYFNCDVFKLASDNGWNREDGKYGPYTNSVVDRYWEGVHGPQSKRTANGASKLGTGYARGGASSQTFAAALAGMTALIAATTPDTVIPGKDEAPEKVLARKLSPEQQRIKDMREAYAAIDTAKNKVRFEDLVRLGTVEIKNDDEYLPMQIAKFCGEEQWLKRGYPHSKKAIKTWRIVNLLCQVGKDVNYDDRLKISDKDKVQVTEEGFFVVKDYKDKQRYKVRIKYS